MIKLSDRYIRKWRRLLSRWSARHVLNLFVFNLILLLMVLLNSAGYFQPFFFLTINRIFFIGLVLSILLLEAREKALFIIALIFFLFAVFLKMVNIGIWADRSSIYAYQSLLLGIVLLFKNILNYNNKRKTLKK